MANMEENRKKLKKKEHAAQEENTNPETPVFDQQKFLEILGGLVERAKKKKNMLEYQEISDAFQSMCLSAARNTPRATQQSGLCRKHHSGQG